MMVQHKLWPGQVCNVLGLTTLTQFSWPGLTALTHDITELTQLTELWPVHIDFSSHLRLVSGNLSGEFPALSPVFRRHLLGQILTWAWRNLFIGLLRIWPSFGDKKATKRKGLLQLWDHVFYSTWRFWERATTRIFFGIYVSSSLFWYYDDELQKYE